MEKDGKIRVMRIMMNVITSNFLIKEVVGECGSLPWVEAWCQVVMVMGEVMVVFSEDQAC